MTCITKHIMDVGEAIVVLDLLSKHWTFQCENANDQRRGYSVKVWADGRRFTVQRTMKIDALNAAINRIRNPKAKSRKRNTGQKSIPRLRLVRS